MHPPLTWVGSKRWHALDIAERFLKSDARRFVELFCGSCAVTLGFQPSEALLNDANPHLINFYTEWQAGRVHPEWTGHDTDPYWTHRKTYNELNRHHGDRTIRAELFYYLNHFAFNGLWRVNRDGDFNVPPRPYSPTRTLPPLEPFPSNANWTFTIADFRHVELRPTDFVYADPPYDATYTGYTSDGFSWDDQRDLALMFAVHPGPVCICNAATQRIVELYHQLGYRLEYPDARQRFHRSRGRTDAIVEVCAFRNC